MTAAEAWREQAACRDMSQTIFFPVKWNEEHCRTARSICSTCPVKGPCLEEALKVTVNDDGIFAGTTPSQRRKIRAKNSPAWRTCVMCGEAFMRPVGKGGTQPVTCSELCRFDRNVQIKRESDERRRPRGETARGKRVHGSPGSGCGCAVCRRVEAMRRRRHRLAARSDRVSEAA